MSLKNSLNVFECHQRPQQPIFGLTLDQLLYSDLDQLFDGMFSRRNGGQEVTNTEKTFEIKLDCNYFRPEELTVKTTDDSVVIEGKHEERDNRNGCKSWVSRQFSRNYILPIGCDSQQVMSSLDSNGMLNITAPKHPVPELKDGERLVAIAVKDSQQKTIKDKN